MAEFPEIKSILETGSRVLLICEKNRSDLDYLSAAASLFYTLRKIGKVVNCHPEELAYNLPCSLPLVKDAKSFVLTIKDHSGILSDIYYQKRPQEIKLFFTMANGEFKTDDIRFAPLDSQLQSEPDLIITMGISSLESLEDFYEENFKFFTQKPILNIDDNALNEEFGKINLIEEDSSFSGLTTQLIRSINKEAIDTEVATYLLGGILSYHKNKNLNDNELKTLIYLKNRGADIKKAIDSACANLNTQERHIMEILLTGLEFNKRSGVPLLLIPKAKTHLLQSNNKSLVSAVTLLRGKGISLPVFLMLWETESLVSGIMYSLDAHKMQKMSSIFSGEIKNDKLIFYLKHKNIQEVQNSILKIIA